MPVADNEIIIKTNKDNVDYLLNKSYNGQLFVLERGINISEELIIVGAVENKIDYDYSQWILLNGRLVIKIKYASFKLYQI